MVAFHFHPEFLPILVTVMCSFHVTRKYANQDVGSLLLFSTVGLHVQFQLVAVITIRTERTSDSPKFISEWCKRMQNPDMDLALSTDAKPRLKWTPVLHQRFIEAVAQLGGADKATPKNIMRVMGIPGLTLYHLKSHLQKYRLGKNQQLETCNDSDREGYTEVDRENEIESSHVSGNTMGKTQFESDESLQIAQALQMQMEVQEKLHKQIEVQRRLQLRIEAQGKYLQSILTKAQETLAGYSSSSMGPDEAEKTEVYGLVSIEDTRLLRLTNTSDFFLNTIKNRSMRKADCSLDSSLTSSESNERKDEVSKKLKTGNPTVLQLMDISSNESNPILSYQLSGRKRSGSTISDESSVEQPLSKRSSFHQERPVNQLRKPELSEEFDMNRVYQSGMDSGKQDLDLNCADDDDESLKHFGA